MAQNFIACDREQDLLFGLLPGRVVSSGRGGLWVSEGIVPGLGDLGWGSVVQARVGPVVVAVDVGADHLPGLVEGLELVQPDAALLELSEPALDERLALGVAVAAAAVRDPEPGEDELERPGGERRAVVGAQRQRPRPDAAGSDRAVDESDALLGAAAQLEVPADDLAGAAVDRGHQVDPAVLANPDRGHVQMPELVGSGDLKEAWAASTIEPSSALDQPPLAHDPEHAAKRGDRLAEGRLLDLYEPMVRRIAGSLYLPGGEREDLAQEARLGLLGGIRAWDPGRS